MIDIFHMTKNY